MSSAPSMVTRTGNSLVVRSVVSGNTLFVDNNNQIKEAHQLTEATNGEETDIQQHPSEDGVIKQYTADEEEDIAKSLPNCRVRRNYACDKCEFSTRNPRLFLYHGRDRHALAGRIHECVDCCYASRQLQKLLRHTRIVHGKNNIPAVQTSASPGTPAMATVMSARKTRKRKRLIEEDDDFNDKAQNNSRNNNMPPNDTSEKSKSSTQWSQSSETNSHIRTRFFRCVKCSYATHVRARFTKHVKYHSMPMIKCSLCDFRTPYKWNLDRHGRNHGGSGAFACRACDFAADIKQSLTVHEMNHHVPPLVTPTGGTTTDADGEVVMGVGGSRRRNKVGASDANQDGGTVVYKKAKKQAQMVDNMVGAWNSMFGEKIGKNNNQNCFDSSMPVDLRSDDSGIGVSLSEIKQPFSIKNNSRQFNEMKKKKSRPIPNLIPIQQQSHSNQQSKTVLKVPSLNHMNISESEPAVLSPIDMSQREINDMCANSTNSALRDFTSLFGDEPTGDTYNDVVEITPVRKETISTSTPLPDQTIELGKKNASFFDRLKEKLLNASADSNGLNCKGCNHVSKCLSEFATHQKTCGKFVTANHDAIATISGSTRCQYCRQRCKSSQGLYVHMQTCMKANNSLLTETEVEQITADIEESDTMSLTDERGSESSRQAPHPMENVVFVWNNISEQADEEQAVVTAENLYDEAGISKIDLGRTSSPWANSETTCSSSADAGETRSNTSLSRLKDGQGINGKPATHGTDLDLASAGAWKRVFKCPHCSFWATTASRFHVHIVGHLNRKPFECSICSYRSNWRWDITKHIRLKSARDSQHSKARVLMTDETGRRNYSKYNKYLTQMDNESGESTSNMKSGVQTRKSKVIVEEDKREPTPVVKSEPNEEVKTGRNRKPVPQLKSVECNLFVPQKVEQEPSPQKNESKKKVWKCKKCNFRDTNHDVLLDHVKEHYRSNSIKQNCIDEEEEECSFNNATVTLTTATTTPSTTRHCRLKHKGDVRVLVGKTESSPEKTDQDDQSDDCTMTAPNQCSQCPFTTEIPTLMSAHLEKHIPNPNCLFQCSECPFFVLTKPELEEHLQLHGIVDFPKEKSVTEEVASKRYQCDVCPYTSNSKSQFLYHKQFHKPRGGSYKCDICNYNVTQKHLLHQHLKVHGIIMPRQKSPPKSVVETEPEVEVVDTIEESTPPQEIDMSEINLRTENFTDIPLVWVQIADQFMKMFKCRFCPYTNIQICKVQEHEKMHFTEAEYKCNDCAYACDNSNIFNIHMKYHSEAYGLIHCLVDPEKTDEEQISQLSQFLTAPPISTLVEKSASDEENQVTETVHVEEQIKPESVEKMMHFCDQCPARFLSKKEYGIHIKLHTKKHPFRCSCCTYTAKQNAHLLSHMKVHTEEYQEKTKKMQMMYETHFEHPQPPTAVLMNVPDLSEPAWVTVSADTQETEVIIREINDVENQITATKVPNKQYSCEICPARFFKSAALDYHLTLHGNNYPFKCTLCNFTDKIEQNLFKHEQLHREQEEEYIPEPKIKSRSSGLVVPISGTDLYNQRNETQRNIVRELQPAMLNVDPQFGILMNGNPDFIYPTYMKNGRVKEKRYKCHKCPSAFEKREQYKVHLTLHGSKQRYQCDNCDYSVKYFANYKQHQTKHQMNEEAQIARRKSTTDSDEIMANGETSHYAIKTISSNKQGPLKLSVADRQSLMILQQRRGNINESQKETVDDKKPHWCPYCPYVNYRRDSLDNHIKRHMCVSGCESNYTCKHCDFSVPQSHFLRDHMKLHFLPMKCNKVEAYMINCDRLELEVSEVGEDGEKCVNVFKDNGEEKEDRFCPVLDEKTKECLDCENGHKTFVSPNTGEPKHIDEAKEIEPVDDCNKNNTSEINEEIVNK